MKSKWKIVQLGLLLFALPLVATAVVSANQWMKLDTPIKLNLDETVIGNGIGVSRVHQVAVNANGVIEGRIASISTDGSEGLSELTVYFLRDGKISAETKTAADGSFAVQGLQPGNYSFVATGDKGFAAYGVQVVADATGQIDNVMEAAAVSPNFASVKKILTSNLPEKVATEIVSNAVEGVAVQGANRVVLDNGQLKGNVLSLVSGANNGTKVFILKDDQEIAEVSADEKGSFAIADLQPGVYGFVAAGPTGFAAVGFEAVDGGVEDVVVENNAAEGFDLNQVTEEAYADTLDVALTCTQDVGFVDNSMVYNPGYVSEFAPVEYVGESVAYGGACGSACGSCGNYSGFQGGLGGGPLRAGLGGGGGGGLLGGGIGRLALLGGAVVGIVAIADDDDNGAASPAVVQ